MAQQIKVTMVDDLLRKLGEPDAEAQETIRFGLDGTEYEIDLNEGNAAVLRDALKPFTGAARKISARSRRRRRTDESGKIREWAEANGIDVKPRGRVPAPVVQRYEKAHATEPASF